MLSGNRLLDLRRRQIDTLKIFNNNVAEIKVNEEYSVGFISDGRHFMLNVHLGTNFPNEKPKIVVTPRIQHDWITDPSTAEVQKAPGLLNFTIHSDLGRVVHAIIREFEKFPPSLWPPGTPTHAMSLKQSHSQSTTQLSPHSIANQTKSSNDMQNDANQSSIPELCNLSLEELQKLEQDPQYLNDFVDELAIVQRIQSDLDALIVNVETIAHENLAQEQRIQQLRTVLETRLGEFRRHGEAYDVLCQRYQKKSEEFAPQHIKELLQIAASNADSVCDMFVEQFISGSMDVQQFIDQYKEAKRISAMRKAKEERLSHQLNELERATF